MSITLTAPDTYTATIAGTEWQGITPASRFWADVQVMIADGVEVVDLTGPPSAEEVLAAERAAMTPFVRAFRAALKLLPATGYLHLLDQVTQLVEGARTADPFSDLVVWWDGVTQIVREHADMDDFGAIIGLSPLQIDAICRLAMAIERGDGQTIEADLVTAFVAL